jgi:hypothetical protein
MRRPCFFGQRGEAVGGNIAIDFLDVGDRAAILERWQLPNHRWIIGLNRFNPLAGEIRDVLDFLAAHFPARFIDAGPSASARPASLPRREADLDRLFGSSVRTITLATLEALGGEARSGLHAYCAPGVAFQTCKKVVKFYVRQGVLERRTGLVSFSGAPWTPALRNLMKAYLRLRPEIMQDVERQLGFEKRERRRFHHRSVIGPRNVEGLLVELATNGPTRHSSLLARVKTKAEQSLPILVGEGIVASLKMAPYGRLLSINAAHPLYREILDLLLALGGVDREGDAIDLRDDSATFSAGRLFWDRLRTALLLTLEAAPKGEMDLASLIRVIPDYSDEKIWECAHRLLEQGLLVSRPWNGMVLYALNSDLEIAEPLRRLLRGANAKWPERRVGASLEERLYPDGRRAREKRPRMSARK